MATEGDSTPIGIDLGTTNSGVARLERGQPQMIPSETGDYTVPSIVAFNEDRRLVGAVARDQAGENPANTIFEVKRLIGMRMTDATVKEDMKKWPFTVTEDEEGKPQVRVSYNGEDKCFYPEQISAMVLTKLKMLADYFYRQPITKAVITVPAAFNDAQRQATIDAGQMAGLDVLRIINEPTAAAIAFGHTNAIQPVENRRVLVFDLGGGTFDVSILSMQKGEYKVVCTLGDVHLGGGDFDARLQAHFESEFEGIDLKKYPRATWRLRSACEKAKKELSTATRSFVYLDNLVDGKSLNGNITRAKFEELCADLFDRTISITKKCLEDAKLTSGQIDDVVLIGGSSRIPKIRELVGQLFGEEKIRQSINPDEAVAQGAVLQAALLLKTDEEDEVIDLVVRDNLPRSLGIDVVGDVTNNILKRGSTLPATETKRYFTTRDNQRGIRIIIMEGESELSKENNELDRVRVEVPPAPAGKEAVDVTFNITENGVLEVTARSVTTGQARGTFVRRDRKQFTQDEINEHRRAEAQMQQQNERQAERDRVEFELEKTAFRLRKVPSLKKTCGTVLDWLNSTANPSKQELDDRLSELKHIDTARNSAREALQGKAINLKTRASMQDACTAALHWIESNKATASEQDFKLKLAELEKAAEPTKAMIRFKSKVDQAMHKWSDLPEVQDKCRELNAWLENCDSSTDEEVFSDKLEELTDLIEDCNLERPTPG